MTTTDTEALASLLQDSGVGWILNEDREVRLQQIGLEIEEASQEIAQRLELHRFQLLREMLTDPSALKPLIQLFASPTSKDMRTMTYCVLRGMEIKSIEFSYLIKSKISLHIVLDDTATGKELRFTSGLAWDAEILRHIGIMTMGRKPVLHGFYAFR